MYKSDLNSPALFIAVNAATNRSSARSAFDIRADAGCPYSGLNAPSSILSVLSQGTIGANASTDVALASLRDALDNNEGPINVIAYSGGAQVFAAALGKPACEDKAVAIFCISGLVGTLPTVDTANVTVVQGRNKDDVAAMVGTSIPTNVSCFSDPGSQGWSSSVIAWLTYQGILGPDSQDTQQVTATITYQLP